LDVSRIEVLAGEELLRLRAWIGDEDGSASFILPPFHFTALAIQV
jgi:hypothetical protein